MTDRHTLAHSLAHGPWSTHILAITGLTPSLVTRWKRGTFELYPSQLDAIASWLARVMGGQRMEHATKDTEQEYRVLIRLDRQEREHQQKVERRARDAERRARVLGRLA